LRAGRPRLAAARFVIALKAPFALVVAAAGRMTIVLFWCSISLHAGVLLEITCAVTGMSIDIPHHHRTKEGIQLPVSSCGAATGFD
jgi:hypothetical protein